MDIQKRIKKSKTNPVFKKIRSLPLDDRLITAFSEHERKMIVTAIVCFYGKLNLQLQPEEIIERYGFTYEEFRELRVQLDELDEIDVDLVTRGGAIII